MAAVLLRAAVRGRLAVAVAAAVVVGVVAGGPRAAAQAPVPFDLVLFDAAVGAAYGAACLDGSPAGYYLSEGGSDTWVLFMEGGGACYAASGPASCWLRYNTSLGSSTSWPAAAALSGNFFVRDCGANPAFCNASYVYVPYCTGDVHGGQRAAPVSAALPFQFSGHNNIRAIMDSLLNSTSLRNAAQLLVSGSSAGGFGTFINADYIASVVPPTVRVRAAPQGGYFFPAVVPFAAWSAGSTGAPYAGQNASVAELWQAYGNAACVAAHGPAYCNSVLGFYPYIQTPMFIVENQADSNQVRWWHAHTRMHTYAYT